MPVWKAVSFVEYGSNRDTSIETKREVAEALESIFPAAISGGMRKIMEEQLMTDKEWIAKLARGPEHYIYPFYR